MGVHLKKIKHTAKEDLARRVANRGGWISYEDFMHFALYDPVFGYYSSQIRDVGRRGDFSTSAHVGSLLGQAIARWAEAQRAKLGGGWRWHLIELGGGNGALAATVLRSLPFWLRLGLIYHLVEISKPLRERQKLTLQGYRVQWHTKMEEALHAAKGVALVFSNELVDAYPCRRVRRHGMIWEEMGIAEADGEFYETGRLLTPAEVLALPQSFSAWPTLQQPQIFEIHSSYRIDLLEIAGNLTRGILLTIDYGDLFPALYHRQPLGTARGYFHHLRIDGPELYTRIGQQDLTADVNFSDLQVWGTEAGLRNESLQTQRDFLLHGLGPIVPKTTDDARLLDPQGAGGAFKVLQQSRGL